MKELLEQLARDVTAALGLDAWRSRPARVLPITRGTGSGGPLLHSLAPAARLTLCHALIPSPRPEVPSGP